MNRAFLMFLAGMLMCSAAYTHAAEARDDSVIRAAASAGKPIIIARVLDSKLIAQGTRSQQLDYRVEVIQTLSARRESWIDSVAHYSSDSLQTRLWHRGWIYLFVFDRPDVTVPLYSEPLSRFGSRKAEIMKLIHTQKHNASTQPGA